MSTSDDLNALRFRLAAAGGVLVALLVVGVIGYRLLAPESGWIDAFYMTVITLTTVGFGEIVPLDGRGRLFTSILILIGMGGVLYFVSTATAFVLEGQLTHLFWKRRMQRDIERLTDHLIVCGDSPAAVYAIRELRATDRAVVLIIPEGATGETHSTLAEAPDALVVRGDPAEDEVLLAAGLARAAGLAACTTNDRDNLVITLSARQLNPAVRIVASVKDLSHTDKLRKVGADGVVSPESIGGLRLASELIRPHTVSFLDIMLRDRDLNLRIDEISISGGSRTVGRTAGEIRDMDLGRALFMALRRPDGDWVYYPPNDTRVAAGSTLILMGSPDDFRLVCDLLDGTMISKPLAGRA